VLLNQEGEPEGSGGEGGAIMPCAAMSSRAGPRRAGHLRAKINPQTQLTMPPMATVTGAPMWSASLPATSDPSGAMPRNIMV
jgi:hypothetical protein